MFRMTLKWSVSSGEARAITSALQVLMIATRAEPGCEGCSLATNMGQQVVLRYVEDWKTEDALKRQIRSSRFAVFAELMEHASKRPTIEFALPGATRDLDYAEEVRQSVER